MGDWKEGRRIFLLISYVGVAGLKTPKIIRQMGFTCKILDSTSAKEKRVTFSLSITTI